MGAVHHGHGAVLMGEGGQFADRRNKTRGAVDVGEDHDLCTRRDVAGEGVDDLPRRIRAASARGTFRISTCCVFAMCSHMRWTEGYSWSLINTSPPGCRGNPRAGTFMPIVVLSTRATYF